MGDPAYPKITLAYFCQNSAQRRAGQWEGVRTRFALDPRTNLRLIVVSVKSDTSSLAS